MTCDIVVTPKVTEIVSPALRSARLLQLRQSKKRAEGRRLFGMLASHV